MVQSEPSEQGFPRDTAAGCRAKSVPMGTASASPQIPEHLTPQHKKTLRQRLHLTPESKAGRLFRCIFGRPLATAETETQKVGPVQGVPILGLDALGSASYGPEAALAVLLPL